MKENKIDNFVLNKDLLNVTHVIFFKNSNMENYARSCQNFKNNFLI